MKSLFFCVLLAAIGSSASAKTYSFETSTGMRFLAEETTFDSAKYSIAGCGRGTDACLINGRPATGAIGLPKSVLSRLTLSFQGKEYELDTSGMFDPFLPAKDADLSSQIQGFCYDALNCSIRAVFGDAGGSHAVEWRVSNGKAFRTVLSNSGDLVQYFMKNLMPPKYK